MQVTGKHPHRPELSARPLPVWLLGVALLAAAPAAAADADGGVARGYFKNLKLQPAHFADSGERRQNILWIVVDALRPDHLGLYGYDRPTSPFLDRYSRDALVFVNHVANAPWTRSSTASMLTGLYPSAHRTQSDRSKLPDELRTVAQDLQQLGYRTAAVVGNGNASRVANLDRGFDDYVDTTVRWKGLPGAADVYGEALSWLEGQRPSDRPWFLFVFLVDPHDPYHAPPEYEQQWLKGLPGKPRRTAHWEYQNRYPAAERRSMLALYDAAIRYTDDETQRFFAAFDRLGLGAQTTVVITADHGEAFGEHGIYLHAYHHYDEHLRVPLIIKSPAWQGQGHVLQLTQSVDLAPTLVGLAGGRPRPELVGSDLTQLLKRPVDRTRIALSEYHEFGIHRSAIFNLQHKVILQLPADRAEFLTRIPKVELLPSVSFDREVVQVFDRAADPHERRDLAPAGVPVAAQPLVQTLRDYMNSAPRANQDVDPAKLPSSVVDDLRSLGYVQ